MAGCGGMWQGVVAGGGDRVWGHVAGCGGVIMKYVVGGQSYCMDGDMWQGWQHVAGCGGMW